MSKNSLFTEDEINELITLVGKIPNEYLQRKDIVHEDYYKVKNIATDVTLEEIVDKFNDVPLINSIGSKELVKIMEKKDERI